MADAIKVDGLAQFSRNLKKLDADLPKALRIALNQAADVVVSRAVPRIPKRTGRAARTVKPRSTRTAVRVGAGGNRAPYYPWLDFGGSTGHGHKKGKPDSGSIKRPFLKGVGRYLYPSYFDLKASGEFERVLTKALLDVAAQAGVVVE